MLFYSFEEMIWMLAAAIAIDWLVGDPKWPTHPVIYIGRWIRLMERKLAASGSPSSQKVKGTMLTLSTILLSFVVILLIVSIAHAIHAWLGYIVSTWFISTTIAIKGLKDAAYRVYEPLRNGNIQDARTYTGYIVGRDTAELGEAELTRAVVETVSENIVDAVIAPLF
jgi:adenosylcobinamide-phosphate synthase